MGSEANSSSVPPTKMGTAAAADNLGQFAGHSAKKLGIPKIEAKHKIVWAPQYIMIFI